MNKKPFIEILGAGPAGLSAGYFASNADIPKELEALIPKEQTAKKILYFKYFSLFCSWFYRNDNFKKSR